MDSGPHMLTSEKQQHPCAEYCLVLKQNCNENRGHSTRPWKSLAANLIGKINETAPFTPPRVPPTNLACPQKSHRLAPARKSGLRYHRHLLFLKERTGEVHTGRVSTWPPQS